MHTVRWFFVLACLGCSGAEETPAPSPDASAEEAKPTEAKAATETPADPALGAANLKSCKAWVGGVKALPCAKNALEGEQCPDALTIHPKDLSAYFDCMASKYTCTDEGALAVADVTVCSPLLAQ